jgi:hypothetical protein
MQVETKKNYEVEDEYLELKSPRKNIVNNDNKWSVSKFNTNKFNKFDDSKWNVNVNRFNNNDKNWHVSKFNRDISKWHDPNNPFEKSERTIGILQRTLCLICSQGILSKLHKNRCDTINMREDREQIIEPG